MFERYTEKARRTIFFARYEASQHGTPYIETPCLLLGLAREDKDLMARLLPTGPAELARLCADVEALLPNATPEKISTSVDLPLSQASKRVLSYAAEEAERRKHDVIEPRHLLWGLLTEGGPETGCLKSHGIALETVSGDLEQLAAETAHDARKRLSEGLSTAGRYGEYIRLLNKTPAGRMPAAMVLLRGLAEGKFEVTGTSRDGSFHFSFDDDKTE
jgi:ATP-dependent Clp protease ATP-binding subunit ClpC